MNRTAVDTAAALDIIFHDCSMEYFEEKTQHSLIVPVGFRHR